MTKYGIIGWPVQHSVSPPMQIAAFKEVGVDIGYDLIAVKPENLAEKIEELKREEYQGWNVTIPYKQAILSLLDEVSPDATSAESVNTVVNRGGRLVGYSTDGYGLAMAINESFQLELKGKSFLFWGTGGATVAASMYFARQGASKIYLVNRTLTKAEALKIKLFGVSSEIDSEVIDTGDFDRLSFAFQEADVVIQSTSVGLRFEDPIAIPTSLLTSSTKFVDMIYRPTKLMKKAQSLGIDCIDGRGMLLHQGAESFSIWTGKKAPVEVMRKALNTALVG